jgi:predicted nucleotidyltransferase component of viral defense system
MSAHFYKDALYPLQDRVLALIGLMSSPFYLTGGTALGRFMLCHRYSDDLDFFINRNADFFQEVDKLIDVF